PYSGRTPNRVEGTTSAMLEKGGEGDRIDPRQGVIQRVEEEDVGEESLESRRDASRCRRLEETGSGEGHALLREPRQIVQGDDRHIIGGETRSGVPYQLAVLIEEVHMDGRRAMCVAPWTAPYVRIVVGGVREDRESLPPRVDFEEGEYMRIVGLLERIG